MLDGRNDPVKTFTGETADADEEAPLMTAEEEKDDEKDETDEDWRSTTEAAQPLTNDRSAARHCSTQFCHFDRKEMHRPISTFYS